eukprot:736831_1
MSTWLTAIQVLHGVAIGYNANLECSWISQYFYTDLHHPTDTCLKYKNSNNRDYMYGASWKYHCDNGIPQIIQYNDLECDTIASITNLVTTSQWEFDYNCEGSSAACNNTEKLIGIIDTEIEYMEFIFLSECIGETSGWYRSTQVTCYQGVGMRMHYQGSDVCNETDAEYAGPSIPSQFRFPLYDSFPSIFMKEQTVWNCPDNTTLYYWDCPGGWCPTFTTTDIGNFTTTDEDEGVQDNTSVLCFIWFIIIR